MEAAVNTDQQGLQGYEEAMVGMNDAKDDAFSHVSIHSSPSSNAGSVSAGMITLFINKRFVLNKMFQRNALKFAIFYV